MKSYANLLCVDGDQHTSVCVLGTGLIGGSLLRAAIRAGFTGWGYTRSESAAAAARTAGYEVSTDLAATLARAAEQDALIVLAVPMPAIATLLTAIAKFAPHCAFTDVVSIKGPVLAAVHQQGLSAHFVGGHPMAGTSQSGWSATTPDLFRDAAWAVSVDEGTDPEVWTRVVRLALACGSVVVPVVAEEHDQAVARISHLPHVLAEALATAGAAGGRLALGLAAGSFRDGTRVAGTAPELVRAICEPNAAALVAVLDEALIAMAEARDSLRETGSLAALCQAGHRAYTEYTQTTHWAIPDIRPGTADWLTQLRTAGRTGGVITSLT